MHEKKSRIDDLYGADVEAMRRIVIIMQTAAEVRGGRYSLEAALGQSPAAHAAP